MMNRTLYRLFTPAALTLAVQLAHAADQEMDTLVVTASRLEESADDLSVSISSTHQDQLELDQGQHIQDSTRGMAGVTINQLSGSSSHNTGIRLPLTTSAYYSFLQDSIPLQSNAFFNHNGLRWSSYNTSADRIEVLKGAGTTLYGAGAVAGTVNVLSPDPSFSPEGQFSLMAGEEDYAQIRLQHSDALGDNQAYLVALSALQDSGWRDHTARDRKELLIKHLWEISENQELKTQLQLSRSNDEMAGSLSKEQYRTRPESSGLSDAVLAVDPVRESDFARLSAEWTYYVNDDLSLSVIPYLRHNTNDYIATWQSYTPQSDSTVDTYGVLSKLNWTHDNGSLTLFGLDYEHSTYESESYQPLDVSITNYRGVTTDYVKGFQYRDLEITYKSVSPYVQHTFVVTDQLSLEAGLRYERSQFALDNHLAETDDDGYGNRQLADRSDDFDNTSGKLGAVYQINDQHTLYARMAQASTLPTGSALYNLKSGDSKSLVGGLEEETSTTYEVGYRYHANDLRLSLALYDMSIEDAIVTAKDDNNDSYRTNAGETSHQGVELELFYRLSPEWATALAYSYTRNEFDRYVNNDVDYSGNEMRLAPHTKATATVTWTPSAMDGLTTQLAFDYFGDYWMDDANTHKGKGYTLAHLKGEYAVSSSFTVFGRVENLFDRKYAYQTDYSYGREKYYPGAERTVRLGMKYAW
jgi:iron complex outermembrane receptor protein